MRNSDQPEPRYCVNLYAFPKSKHSACSVIPSSKISELISASFDIHCTFINLVHLVLVSTVEGNYIFVKTQGLSLYTCCEHVYVQVVMYSMLVYYLISLLHHFCTVAKQTPQTPAFVKCICTFQATGSRFYIGSY